MSDYVYNYGTVSDIIFVDESDVITMNEETAARLKAVKRFENDDRTMFVFDDYNALNVYGRPGAVYVNNELIISNEPVATVSTTDTVAPVNFYENASYVKGSGNDEVLVGNSDSINVYVYDKGNVTISNFQSWDKIEFNGNYQNWSVDGDDFIVSADEGSVRVRDVRGKVMEFAKSDGEFMFHACLQTAGDSFDGEWLDEPVVVVGANDGSNIITASDAGSSMWGGNGAYSDMLIGGDGVDNFIYNCGNGNDTALVDSNDIINLSSVQWSDIKGAAIDSNSVRFIFNDFGSLDVFGRAGSFIINNETYNVDYDNKTMSKASE